MAFGGGGIPAELGSELPDVFTDVCSRLDVLSCLAERGYLVVLTLELGCRF